MLVISVIFMNFLKSLFATDFMPHGYCMRWSPDLIWLHVLSDGAISASYFAIPLGLVVFFRRRRDMDFNWIFFAFAMFILACGTTHLLSIVTLWQPVYRLDGVVKAITAAVSATTAVLLWRLMPTFLAIPSPAALREEIFQRQRAEQKLQELNAGLERRVAERTETLAGYSRTLERIAYVAGHDLREPVRTVSVFTQLLQQDLGSTATPRQAELMRFALEGCRRMERLVGDLLEVTRTMTEASKQAHADVVPLEDALQTALTGLRGAMTEAAARVESRDLPVVRADRQQVEQLLQNLIGNAIKYRHPARSPLVEISAERQGPMQHICVRDNGQGIPMDRAARIFDPFQRLHGREVPGSGIGLAICRAIVEGTGGHIWVESAGPGQGSTFHFTLPAVADSHEPSGEPMLLSEQ